MREILFRGKREDNGEWVYGSLINIYDKHKKQYCFIIENEYCYYNNEDIDILPETVGQFTGLTDKNGKKIFEGDIIKVEYKSLYEGYDTQPRIGDVYFEDGCFKITDCYSSDGYNELSCISGDCCVYSGDWENALEVLEVIGNIHDNPELLEVEE